MGRCPSAPLPGRHAKGGKDGQSTTSPRKETNKDARKKGKHNNSKGRLEKLEQSMKDLTDNQIIIYQRFKTLMEL